MTLGELLERLRRIPDEARTWGCDARDAHEEFGLDAATLSGLVERGLPTAGEAGAARFEQGDLHCVGLRLGCATTYLWAVRRWADSLALLSERDATAVEVEYVPQLAAGVASAPAVALLPDGERRAVMLENGRAALMTSLTMQGRWPELPARAAQLAREVAAELAFCPLPVDVRGDTRLARHAGLSDCMTAAFLLVEEWQAAGLEARVGAGLLVSEPYSTLHTWAEVHDGGTWLPADPLMVSLMCDVGGLDRARWPPDRSVGAFVHRIARQPDALVTAPDGVVEVSFMTVINPSSD